MFNGKIDIGVSDEQIRIEYESGKSLYAISKEYNTRFGIIKRRVINAGGKLRKLRFQNYWTDAEDKILILLRYNGYNTREISMGMLERSHKSVTNRLIILRRDRKIDKYITDVS